MLTVNVGRAWNEARRPHVVWALLKPPARRPPHLQLTLALAFTTFSLIKHRNRKNPSMSEKIDATSTSTETGSGGAAGPGAGASGLKAIIKNVDMSEEMQQESVDVASGALEKYNIEKDIAAQIKKEFDKRHGATWHVVVGKNFGSYVTHGTPFIACYENRNKPCHLVVQKRSISSTFTSALSLFSSGSHNLTYER